MNNNEKINLMDYIELVFKARKFLFWNFFIVTSAAVAVSFMLPKYYESSIQILPPQDAERSIGFSDALSIPRATFSFGTRGTPVDIAIGQLKSRTIANEIIENFDLINVYGSKDREEARRTLRDLTSIILTREGIIELSVEDKAPERAAEIANTYGALLDSMKRAISRREAEDKYQFVAEQLMANHENLLKAENELKEFQFSTRAILPSQQQTASVSALTEFELQLLSRQTELDLLRKRGFTDSHSHVIRLKNSISALEQLMSELRSGTGVNDRSVLVPLEQSPDLTMEFAKKFQRVQTLTMLDQILRQHYEDARIEQGNIVSTITIIDHAEPAFNKSRPKRKLIVLAGGSGSILLSLMAVFFVYFLNILVEENPRNKERVEEIARFLRINR